MSMFDDMDQDLERATNKGSGLFWLVMVLVLGLFWFNFYRWAKTGFQINSAVTVR